MKADPNMASNATNQYQAAISHAAATSRREQVADPDPDPEDVRDYGEIDVLSGWSRYWPSACYSRSSAAANPTPGCGGGRISRSEKRRVGKGGVGMCGARGGALT